jgi:hypothetical protein
MNGRIQTPLLATIVAGALMMQAAPAIARDYWHWSEGEHRWNRRADLRSDYHDLTEAKRQLEWDRRHHASRRKIAEDRARIRDLERDIHEDRRALK